MYNMQKIYKMVNFVKYITTNYKNYGLYDCRKWWFVLFNETVFNFVDDFCDTKTLEKLERQYKELINIINVIQTLLIFNRN